MEAVRAVWDIVDEVVIVNAESTDGTRDVLDELASWAPCPFRILYAKWGQEAGKTLARLHAMHDKCSGDIILAFEGDEVFDEDLARDVVMEIRTGRMDIAVWRIQVEQNFQRVRWYPKPVHRVFPRGSVAKIGETTDRHHEAYVMPAEHGFLWDVTNCFRDNWLLRVKNQARLRKESLNLLAVPEHVNEPVRVEDVDKFLAEPHWTWTKSPFDLPKVLLPHVGATSYVPDFGRWR